MQQIDVTTEGLVTAPAPSRQRRNGMPTKKLPTNKLLEVYAMGVYRVELSDGRQVGASKRLPLFARVDSTGKVEFYVDPEAVPPT